MKRRRVSTFTKQELDQFMRLQDLEFKIPTGQHIYVRAVQGDRLANQRWDGLKSTQKFQIFKYGNDEDSQELEVWIHGFEKRARRLGFVPHRVKGDRIPIVLAEFCDGEVVPKRALQHHGEREKHQPVRRESGALAPQILVHG